MWNCGKSFDVSRLYKEAYETKLGAILTYLKTLTSEGTLKKIILCGHSMGCVTASIFGYYIFRNDKNYFNNKCIIIGSGPFRWLDTDTDKELYKEFTTSRNVFIFIVRITMGEYLDLYDRILDKAENNYSHFPKMYVLHQNEKIIDNINYTIYKIDDINDEIKNKSISLCNPPIMAMFHDWSDAYKIQFEQYLTRETNRQTPSGKPNT